MVVQNSKYTKHFYIEGQRIVSKLGAMGIEQPLLHPKPHAGDSLKIPVNWYTKKENSKEIIIANFEALGLDGAIFTAGKSGKTPYGQMKKYFRGNDVVINPGGGGSTPSTSNKTEDLQFFYHPDHLGSSNYITDVSGEVYQHQEYFPFGETFIEERNNAEYTTYLFNAKELDEETGLYYYGARYFDPKSSVFLGLDILAEKYPNINPYAYVANNPIKCIDPNGMSTQVTVNENGTYSVVGGNASDGDRGIYIRGKNGANGAKVGQSKTSHSFFDEKEKPVVGAILNPKSKDGQNFLNNLEKDDPSLLGYMANATNGEKYDFKDKGNNDKGELTTDIQYRYRGSVDDNGDFGSARDYGNIGAGLVAARSGLTWSQARLGFDTYQGFKDNGITLIHNKFGPPIITILPVREGTPTVKAEMLGFIYGWQKYQRK